MDRLLHPNPNAPGFSYSFAGGYLDDIFDFDPAVFGMSPREAMEVDPQQRLLLETVFEALEDAWIPRSSLVGKDVGVYVGASSLDHGSMMAADPKAVDRYFMTGNTLSIVANRLSHNFDWHGPSFTVDTACSSSLVAFVQAIADIAAGRVETAIVAGVNVLLNPMSFIGFSRASMLSPTGLCRPFSMAADGYVRSEGAVAIVLRRGDCVVPGSARAWVMAGGTNNDGRTSGIALPSFESQATLLRDMYAGLGISPDRLAFVEAHGTGTQVGDAVEAKALGMALGQHRSAPLPVGSVKSNIGHLEPASGVAGILKALHALESRRLPQSLHIDELNGHIDFHGMGIEPARRAVDLAAEGELLCGVSSFGFGGTNAHIILRSADGAAGAGASAPRSSRHLVLSAATREALAPIALSYADLLVERQPEEVAHAVGSARERMPHRLVVPVAEGDRVADALRSYAAAAQDGSIFEGTAPAGKPQICFAFSGNGTLTVDLARVIFEQNDVFRENFRRVARTLDAQTGRSLESDLFDADYEEKKASASFLQPLVFALQHAIATSFISSGIRPDVVLGHSFGEITAACIAGAITIDEAATIISVRASCQERVRGLGAMAVFSATTADVAALIEGAALETLEIAADNGPSSVTVTGSVSDVEALVTAGRRKRIAGRLLDLQYPFHSKLLDDMELDLLQALSSLRPRPPGIAMISTVTGEAVGEGLLGAEHWWRNFRQPVAYRQALEAAGALGANLFIEISQRPLLLSAIDQTMAAAGSNARVIGSLQPGSGQGGADPMSAAIARAIANGAPGTAETDADPPSNRVDRTLDLPHYAWQKRRFHFGATSGRVDIFGNDQSHPLIGARLFGGSQEWRVSLDSALVPYLADHVIDGEVVVPGAGLVEMMLAVARQIEPLGPLSVEDLDILQAMTLPVDSIREVCIRHTPATGVVEVLSRLNIGAEDWALNARGRLAAYSDVSAAPTPVLVDASSIPVDGLYQKAFDAGLQYGPAFRRLQSILKDHWTIQVDLDPVEDLPGLSRHIHLLHPVSVDASFHALFHELENDDSTGKRSYLPIRFGRVSLLRDHADIASAILKIEAKTDQWLSVSATLFDRDGAIVARLEKALFRSVVLSHGGETPHLLGVELWADEDVDVETEWLVRQMAASPDETAHEAHALLEAHMRTLAYGALRRLCDNKLRLDPYDAVARSKVDATAVPYVETLLADLAAAGIVEDRGEGSWQFPRRSGLPDGERILATFVAENPSATAEIMLATGMMAGLDGYLEKGVPITHRAAVLRQFASGTLLRRNAIDRACTIVEALIGASWPVRPRIVLSASFAEGLSNRLVPLAASHRIRLTIAGSTADNSRLLATLPEGCPVQSVDLADAQAVARAGHFDVALMNVFEETGDIGSVAARMAGLLSAKGALLVAQTLPSPLLDFYFGTDTGWFSGSLLSELPVGRLSHPEELVRFLTRSGLREVRQLTDNVSSGQIILARRRKDAEKPSAVVRVLHQDTSTASTLIACLKRLGEGASPAPTDTLCLLVPGRAGERDELQQMIELAIDAVTEGDRSGRLWFIVRDAFGDAPHPVSEAIWSSCRVLGNEHADRDIRLLDYSSQIGEVEVAARIATVLAAPGKEREIHLGVSGRSVVRVVPLPHPGRGTPRALRLQLPSGRGISDLSWQPVPRDAPAAQEIEIEVMATGLNFRDVMLAMGLLYDDVLDGGAAGAVLGFECAGRVTAVGEAVRDLVPGDLVCGVAGNALATHVTAPRANFIRVPEGMPAEQAATVPVAFLTAWYGLVEMARVRAGETVLIHGAAGGVGLAALQIARARGAKVVATASTADKRALVRLLGADQVHDSRSLDFSEHINSTLGGVDIVLNSLAGEAMRASLKCLKPFGRFLELGKRDYIANTEIGLRPFRRNLSYFGVDVDQLFAGQPKTAARGLSYILKGFRSGRFFPIPHTTFAGEFVGEAMRLMQGAGHVGKIVVRPPDLPEDAEPSGARSPREEQPFVPSDGVQLIVGGTHGFGFATALWLAEKGARQIVLASRGGALGALEAKQAARFAELGASLTILPLDVTDAGEVANLVEHVAGTIAPITGVYNAAAVLSDGFAANLTFEQISRVLAPKIDGTINLDRATRSQPIREFVVFSSEASLVGNPGQTAYAAANAFMHGIVRRRRRAGLPALAVGWGAVSDVGMLTRDTRVARRLERTTGASGIRAREGLALLADLLGRQSELGDPVVYFGRLRFGSIARDLPIVQAPAFSLLRGNDGDPQTGEEIDLIALLADKPADEAVSVLTGIVIAEGAAILRVPPGEIDARQPLSALGLDSLMALELRMSLETKFGLELPLMAITSVQNLHDLSVRVLDILRSSRLEIDIEKNALQDTLYHMHGGSSAEHPDVVETVH